MENPQLALEKKKQNKTNSLSTYWQLVLKGEIEGRSF